MKHLKRFLESNVNIYDEKIKEFLPNEISIYTSNGNFTLKKDTITREVDILRVCYNQHTPNITGDVLYDGEPDILEFDFHFVREDNRLKILVDISYGDQMVSEFVLRHPDKIDVVHYTGIGSLADPDTQFALEDESIKSVIKFVNSFGFSFEEKDFTFIDKYPESYICESIKLTPLSGNQKILIVNNSKPMENRYLKNVIKFMNMRGISHIIANNDRDVERLSSQENIIGAILTGSDYRFTKPLSDNEGLASKKALEILKCPILGLGYGLDSMAKFHGSDVKDLGKLNIVNKKLSYLDKDCPLFKNININTEFSFAFHEKITNCPKEFKIIAKVDDLIVGISNENQKRYGLLFHPEDIDRTLNVLDNFTDILLNGKKEQEDIKQGKFQHQNLKVFEKFSEENKWLDLLMELTAKTTPAGHEINVEHIILRYGFKKDENGNYYKLNPNSKVLFTAHADNYCLLEEDVVHIIDKNKLETDFTTILGGDNKVGICYLISLIEAGRDYNYYIFKSEEIGRVGSKLLLEKNKSFLENIDIAFAIDRKGTEEIIITQYGAPCCSVETATELKSEFSKHQINLNLSEDGGKCDTYTFRDVVRECVNISDGVFGEHTFAEYVDLDYFYKMIETLKKIDFEKISINRFPSAPIEKINFRKLKSVVVINPDLKLNLHKLQTDNKEPDYINCYFNINGVDEYKAVFYKDLSLKFAKMIKVVYTTTNTTNNKTTFNKTSNNKTIKTTKIRDIKSKVVEPKPLPQEIKAIILEKVQEFIINKIIN